MSTSTIFKLKENSPVATVSDIISTIILLRSIFYIILCLFEDVRIGSQYTLISNIIPHSLVYYSEWPHSWSQINQMKHNYVFDSIW